MATEQPCRQQVMAILKDVGRHFDLIANDA